MSRRKRHPVKQAAFNQIEWFEHRTGYPSQEERGKIIHLREELSFELVKSMVTGIKPNDSQIQALVGKYGAQEVERATRVLKTSLDLQSRVADDAASYREYRQRYARFGAGLKFHTAREIEELYKNHAGPLTKMVARMRDMTLPEDGFDISKELLIGWRDWEDITPPAIPLRLDDYVVPQPAAYPAPINELLEWGGDLKKHHEFDDDRELLHWKKFIPALTRMAFDPGLLNGWPSENPSWAPWHAIHALGNLQAWESAPALAELADLENDWLSDHLSHIWADMGAETEPSLWMILETASASTKRRGLAAESLFTMTDGNKAMENKVVKGFEKILRNANNFNPTLNGHLISFLRDLEAVDDVYPSIEEAFEQNRVDTHIIAPEDLEPDDFDDFDEDDDE